MRHHRWLFFVFVLAIVVLVDRLCKAAAIAQWSSDPITIVPGVQLSFLLNKGIAFSLPFGGVWLLAATAVLVIGLVMLALRSVRQRAQRITQATVLILLGAASNMADRFLYGGVVDYVHIGFLPFVNVADLLILAGVIQLAMMMREEPPRQS